MASHRVTAQPTTSPLKETLLVLGTETPLLELLKERYIAPSANPRELVSACCRCLATERASACSAPVLAGRRQGHSACLFPRLRAHHIVDGRRRAGRAGVARGVQQLLVLPEQLGAPGEALDAVHELGAVRCSDGRRKHILVVYEQEQDVIIGGSAGCQSSYYDSENKKKWIMTYAIG